MSIVKDDYTFEINWLPFFLNSDIPQDGVNREQYFREKYGIKNYKETPMRKNLLETAKELGIEMVDSEKIPNTIKSHMLVEYAKSINKQDAVINSLFERYFEKGENLADDVVLKGVCSDAEIEFKEEIFKKDTSQFVRKVKTTASEIGVNGVPFFIFNNKLAVSGAQPVDVFLKIFKKLV